MEFFDIEGASLCARRCESKLCETTTIEWDVCYEWKMIAKSKIVHLWVCHG